MPRWFVGVWMVAITCGLAYLLIERAHFRTLEVERIDVVEPDGKPRMIIANAARFPGVYWRGHEYPHPGRSKGGLLYFNDDATEAGGLGYANDKAEASGGFTIDQYEQDQTLGLTYEEENGKRAAGLLVWDRPDKSLLPLIVASEAVDHAATAADRSAAEQRVDAAATAMGDSAVRLFAGKRQDDAMLELYDKRGRPRLRMQVDGAGAPSLDFLDGSGNAIAHMP